MANTKQEDLKRIEEIGKLLKENKGTMADAVKLEKERLVLLEKWEETSERQLENAQTNLEVLKQYAALSGDVAAIHDGELEVAEKQLNVHLEELKTLADQFNAQRAAGKDLSKEQEEELTRLQKMADASKERLDLLEKQAEAHDNLAGSVENTVSGLLGSIDASKTFTGQLMLAAGKAGGIGGALKLVGQGLKKALNPANMMAGLFSKIKQSTMLSLVGMDQFRTDLVKAGASLDQYGDSMNDVRDANVDAGVGMKEATQSMLALHKGMADFSSMSEENRTALTSQVAVMSKLGISAETSTTNLETLRKGMSMTGTQAMTANKEIAATASALKMSVADAAEAFAKAGPALAAHGTAGVKVFRELQTQAKATGMAIDELLSIAGEFDTFEGAAEKTALLNATLGTTLNSTDMLLASESERIAMMKQGLAATGKSFESMDRWEKKQAAAVLTGGDVVKLGKIMNADLLKHASAAEKAAMADEELQKKAAAATGAREKFTLMIERFGTALIPLINIAHKFLDILLWINKKLGGAFIPTMVALVGITWLSVKAAQAKLAVEKFLTLAKSKGILVALASVGATQAETVAKVEETAATTGETVSENINTVSKKKGIIATMTQWVWTKISTVWKWLSKRAQDAWNITQAIGTALTNKDNLATIKSWVWQKITWLWDNLKTAAKWAYNLAMQVGTLAKIRDLAVTVALFVWDKLKVVWEWLKTAATWAGIGATKAKTIVEAASIPVTAGAAAATGAAVGPTLAFGAAALMIGIAIAVAAAGLAYLAQSMKGMGIEMLAMVAIVFILAVGMYFLIPALLGVAGAGSAAALPLLALGAAAIMIGLGFAIAAFGVTLIVKAIGALFQILAPMAEVLPIIGLGLITAGAGAYVLAGGMVALGLATPAMLAAAFGLGIVSIALFDFGVALAIVGGGVTIIGAGMILLTTSFERIFKLLVEHIDVLSTVTLAIAGLGASMALLALGIVALGLVTPKMVLASFGLALLAVSLLNVGLGLIVIGVGVTILVANFTTLFNLLIEHVEMLPKLASGIIHLGASFVLLSVGIASLGAVSGLMVLASAGLSIMAVGLQAFGKSIKVVGMGLEQLTKGIAALATMTEPIIVIASSIFVLSKAVKELTVAFVGFAGLAILMVPLIITFGILTMGILALAGALAFIKTDDLKAVSTMVAGLGNVTIDSAVAFEKAMLETKQTVVAIAKEPKAAAILEKTVQSFAGLGGATAPTTSPAAATAAVAGAAQTTGRAGGERTVVLKLNEREFAKAVINILDETQNLATAT